MEAGWGRNNGMKNKNLLESFNRAIDGLVYCFRTQRNFRIHCLAAILVLALSLGLHLTKTEFLFVVVGHRLCTGDGGFQYGH